MSQTALIKDDTRIWMFIELLPGAPYTAPSPFSVAVVPDEAEIGDYWDGSELIEGSPLNFSDSQLMLLSIMLLQVDAANLSLKADAIHSHNASAINSGVLDDARIPSLAIAKITGLQTALDGKAASSHSHAASDITSGTLNDARISQSSVTQHQAALSIGASQVTGSKTSSFISDFTEAAQDAVGAALSAELVYNDAANTIGLRARSFSYLTPTLNSAAQLSATRDAFVSYAVDIAVTISLTAGATGTVFLEIADDSGFTTNVQELARFVNGNTGTLTIGLNLTQNLTGTLTGIVPAGKYRRLRTANTVGTPTFTARPSQEVLL